MCVGTDLEVTTGLPLVHVRVHVADDGVLDIALCAFESRHWSHIDHLVHRGRERYVGAGHPGDADGDPGGAANGDPAGAPDGAPDGGKFDAVVGALCP